jgi:hypothetical protein
LICNRHGKNVKGKEFVVIISANGKDSTSLGKERYPSSTLSIAINKCDDKENQRYLIVCKDPF